MNETSVPLKSKDHFKCLNVGYRKKTIGKTASLGHLKTVLYRIQRLISNIIIIAGASRSGGRDR